MHMHMHMYKCPSRQGVEMGRPSELRAEADYAAGAVTAAQRGKAWHLL